MTYEEGVKQAFRECGDTEEVIAESLKRTARVMAMPTTGEIPAGHERDFIDFIKATRREFEKRMGENPSETIADLLERSKEHNEKN